MSRWRSRPLCCAQDTAWSWLADVTDRTRWSGRSWRTSWNTRGSPDPATGWDLRGAGVRSLQWRHTRAAPGEAGTCPVWGRQSITVSRSRPNLPTLCKPPVLLNSRILMYSYLRSKLYRRPLVAEPEQERVSDPEGRPHGRLFLSAPSCRLFWQARGGRGPQDQPAPSSRAASRTWASCQNADRVTPGRAHLGTQHPGLELGELGDDAADLSVTMVMPVLVSRSSGRRPAPGRTCGRSPCAPGAYAGAEPGVVETVSRKSVSGCVAAHLVREDDLVTDGGSRQTPWRSGSAAPRHPG